MKFDRAAVRKCLKSFDFSTLLREHLGWDKHQAQLDVPVGEGNVRLTATTGGSAVCGDGWSPVTPGAALSGLTTGFSAMPTRGVAPGRSPRAFYLSGPNGARWPL